MAHHRTADAPSRPAREPSSSPTTRSTATVFSVVLGIHLVVVALVRTNGWDDGAITLAFARTLADHGRIALTEHSEVVEGFSSMAWFAWMTVVDWLLPLGFTGLIVASQVSVAVVAATSAVVLYRILGRVSPHHRAMAVIAAAVSVFGLFLNETVNGMEMTLLTGVVLLMVRSLQRRSTTTLLVCAAVVPFVRLEAAAYVVIGALVLAVVNRAAVRTALAVVVATVGAAVVTTVIRLAVFGSVLPNTITAKKSPPYTPADIGAQIAGRQFVIVDLIAVLAPAIVVLVFAMVVVGARSVRAGMAFDRRDDAAAVFAFGYLLGVILVNLALGKNLGYYGRMELSAVPVAVFLVVRAAPDAFGALGNTVRTWVVAAFAIVLSLLSVDTNWVRATANPEASAVTPNQYRKAGQAFKAFGDAAGLSVVTVLTPDVGGSALCCGDLRILDLALLANSELAEKGYDHTADYLAARRPDLIETHTPWTDASHIQDSPVFRADYRPVSVNGRAFYARTDLVAKVGDRCVFRPASTTRSDIGRGADIDEQYLSGMSVCVLSTTITRR